MKRITVLQKFVCHIAVASIPIFAAAGGATDATIEKKTEAVTKSKDDTFQFYDLAEEKAKLVVKIDTLRKEIKSLEEEKIPAAEEEERYTEELKRRLDELKTRETDLQSKLNEATAIPAGRSGTPDANALSRRQSISDQLLTVKRDIELAQLRIKPSRGNSSQVLKDQLQKKTQELDAAVQDLDKVQRAIVRITTPEQSFKRQISAYSSLLIAVVIIGFFVIAGLDSRVRQSVFAGQAGIQFLALFSIVIAIILFGITGILGGNELSALLGSISGYILGKVTTGDGKPAQPAASASIGSSPTNLQATPGSSGEVTVSCAKVSEAESYNWYTKTASSTEFKKAQTTSVPQVVLTGLKAGESVEIKVAASNAAGEGPMSNSITATAGG